MVSKHKNYNLNFPWTNGGPTTGRRGIKVMDFVGILGPICVIGVCGTFWAHSDASRLMATPRPYNMAARNMAAAVFVYK